MYEFEHGPRPDEWLSRAGEGLDCCIGDPGTSIRLWKCAVPLAAFVDDDVYDSSAGDYLTDIRVIVVDQLGVRRPLPGDPLEEACCEDLSALVAPRAEPVEEALGQFPDLDHDLELRGNARIRGD